MRELRRTVFSRPLLGLLAVLAALNCFLLAVEQRKTGFPARDYARVYAQEIAARQNETPEQALAALEALQEEDRRLNVLIGWRQAEDERLRALLREQCEALWGPDFETLPLTVEEDYFLRVEVRRRVRAQVEYLLDYPNYLDAVHANAKTMTALPFFQSGDGFARENIRRTDEDFPRSAELRLDRDMAMEALLSTRVPGWSLAVYLAALALSFVTERRQGLWALLYGTPGGRGRLALRRTGVLLAGAALGTAVIFGACLLTASLLYGGLGDLSRNVQSMAAFRGLPELTSRRRFLLLDLVWRILAGWLLGLLIWAALQAVANLQLAMLGAGLLLAASFAAFTLIPDSFSLVILRYLNPFALVELPRIFLRYLNLNLFGHAVRGCFLTAALLLPALGASAAACVLLQMKKRPVGAGRLRLPLLAFCLWLGVWLEAPPADVELYDTRSAVYEIRLEGPVSAETKSALEEIAAEISDGETLAALERLSERVEESLERSDGRWLVNPVPWAALLNRGGSGAQRGEGLLLLLFLILALSGLFACENRSGMTRLLRGDRRLLRAKLSAAALTLLCIWLLYSLRQLWLISERYAPFSGLAAPANSLQCFSALPGWLPLWAAGLGCLLLRLLAMGAAASVVLLISVWAGSQNQASLAAAAALLIPAALFAVGLESVRLLTPLELLAPLNWRLPLWPIWAGLSAAALVFTLRRWRRKL